MVEVTSYVDVNVFVYWLGNHPLYGEPAYNWIKKMENADRGRYLTSTLTIYQTLVIMAGLSHTTLKNPPLLTEVITSLTSLPGLIIHPLTPKHALHAKQLTHQYPLDYEDSLHLATALKAETKDIISNDQDFDHTPLNRTF